MYLLITSQYQVDILSSPSISYLVTMTCTSTTPFSSLAKAVCSPSAWNPSPVKTPPFPHPFFFFATSPTSSPFATTLVMQLGDASRWACLFFGDVLPDIAARQGGGGLLQPTCHC